MTISNVSAIVSESFGGGMAETNSVAVDEYPSWSDLRLKYVGAGEWDEIAKEFADIIPEQMGSFNAGHWGESNLEFVTVREDENVIGGAPVIVKTIPGTNTGIAILKWGPLCQKIGTEFDPGTYDKIVSRITDEYCRKRNYHLTIMPVPKPEIGEVCENILAAKGFGKGKSLAAPERYIVNVSEDSETLKANLDQKWRYNMRKALKNDFDTEVVDAREGLGEFLGLYTKMIERKKFLDASAIDALDRIAHESPEETRPLIVLVSHANKVTAGGVFHVSGNMATYMFGATDDRALKLKAGYALHWWVAEHLCARKDVQWYDLGGNDLDKGLHQFKKGFVGKSGHILDAPPRYHLSNSLSATLAGKVAFIIRDGMASMKRLIHKVRA